MKLRKGIDDLIPLLPFQDSKYIGLVKKEEYEKDPESYHAMVTRRNETYIKQLLATKKYGQVYQSHNEQKDETKKNSAG